MHGTGDAETPLAINFLTDYGPGQASINWHTFGEEYGYGISSIPTCSLTFQDRGNYSGQAVFLLHGEGSPDDPQIGVMSIGSNGYAGAGLGVAIGVDYTSGGFAMPQNGLIVEGFVGIGTQAPQAALDVNGGGVKRKRDRSNKIIGPVPSYPPWNLLSV